MTDNEIIKAYEGLTSNQQLNLFRGLYYTDGYATERGIIANAINDILPEYHRQKAEIERLNHIRAEQSREIDELKAEIERIHEEELLRFEREREWSEYDEKCE